MSWVNSLYSTRQSTLQVPLILSQSSCFDILKQHLNDVCSSGLLEQQTRNRIEAGMKYCCRIHQRSPERLSIKLIAHWIKGLFSQRRCRPSSAGRGRWSSTCLGDVWPKQHTHINAAQKKPVKKIKKYPTDWFPFLSDVGIDAGLIKPASITIWNLDAVWSVWSCKACSRWI